MSNRTQDIINELNKYFLSGNNVPVERATIKREHYLKITGQTERDLEQSK